MPVMRHGNDTRERLAKYRAVVTLAVFAVRRALHVEFIRERTGLPDWTKAGALEATDGADVCTLNTEPDAGQCEVLAAVMQRAKQQSLAQAAAPVILMQEHSHFRLPGARPPTEHRMANNPFTNFDHELCGFLQRKFSQPFPRQLRCDGRQPLELPFRFKPQIHQPRLVDVFRLHPAERDFHLLPDRAPPIPRAFVQEPVHSPCQLVESPGESRQPVSLS